MDNGIYNNRKYNVFDLQNKCLVKSERSSSDKQNQNYDYIYCTKKHKKNENKIIKEHYLVTGKLMKNMHGVSLYEFIKKMP